MADDTLKKAVADAILQAPPFVKRNIDTNKLQVKEAPPKMGYGHPAIASVADNDPNTILIHDKDAFLNAKPYQRPAMMAHELSHSVMDQQAPTYYKPINENDPYSYDATKLAGTGPRDYSQEQLARMVEEYTAYKNDPGSATATRQRVMNTLGPIVSQIPNGPLATINTDQSGQVDNPSMGGTADVQNMINPGTMNTTPNAPAPMFDSADPVVTNPLGTPTPAGVSKPMSAAWMKQAEANNGNMGDDIPEPIQSVRPNQSPTVSQGSQVVLDFSKAQPIDKPVTLDFSKAQAIPTTQQENQHALRQGLVGVAKGAGDMLVGSSPLGTAVGMIPAVQRTLASNNSDQTAGKIAGAGASMLLNPAEAEGTVDGLVSLLKRGGNAVADRVLPSHAVDALHMDLNRTAQGVATDAGVPHTPTNDPRKIISNLVAPIRKDAQDKMSKVDELYNNLKLTDRGTGGKFIAGFPKDLGLPDNYSGIDDQIKQLTDKRSTLSGPENVEKRAAIGKQITSLSNAKTQVQKTLEQKGLGQAREEADAAMAQANALDNLKAAHNDAIVGPPGPKAQTNPVKLQQNLTPMYYNGELQQAVGPARAEDLMDSTNRAARVYSRAVKTAKAAKIGATVVGGTGSAYELGRAIFK